jgi:hypothetical protein
LRKKGGKEGRRGKRSDAAGSPALRGALKNPLQGLGEQVIRNGHDQGRAGGRPRTGILDVHVLERGDEDDGDFPSLENALSRLDSGHGALQPDVHEHRVGLEPPRGPDRAFSGRLVARDLVPEFFNEQFEVEGDDGVVLDHQNGTQFSSASCRLAAGEGNLLGEGSLL